MTAEPPKGRVGMTQVEVSILIQPHLTVFIQSGKRMLAWKSFSREQKERPQWELWLQPKEL